MKRYYHGREYINETEGFGECSYFTIIGEMVDGSKVYAKVGEVVDEEKELNLDEQYLRTVRHGMQIFYRV